MQKKWSKIDAMIGRIISAMSNRWCDVIIVTVWCNEEEDRKMVERNYEGGKFILHYFEYEIADDMISLECKRGFALFRQMRLPNIWLKISFCINNVRREEGRSECIHLLFTCFALCNQHEMKIQNDKANSSLNWKNRTGFFRNVQNRSIEKKKIYI